MNKSTTTALGLMSLLMTLFVSSCDNDIMPLENNISVENINQASYSKSIEEAEQQALNILDETDKEQIKDCELIFPALQTRTISDSIANNVKFYVINLKNNMGWALIAADKRATDVYAFSTSGNINAQSFLSNVNAFFRTFIESAIQYFIGEIASTHKMKPSPGPDDPFYYMKDEINGVEYYVKNTGYETYATKDPIITTKWNIGSPYNEYFEYYFDYNRNDYDTGLGKLLAPSEAVSLAQIMQYYNYPTTYENNSVNWSTISGNWGCTYMIYKIANTASYSQAKSGNIVWANMSFTNVGNVLSSFGYAYDASTDFNGNSIESSVSNNRPVIIHATDSNSNTANVTWIIDGYIKQKSEYILWYTYPPYDVYQSSVTYRKYYHCNWPISGYPNGYFLDTFQVNSFQYDKNIKQITNIRPSGL